jgi:hypothetical protein
MIDNSLDILNILDVLKNADMYQERLQAIKDATKALNEGKYIGAIMEQATTLMEAAQAAKEQAEAEIREKREQLTKDIRSHEMKMASEFSDLEKQRLSTNKRTAELEQWERKMVSADKDLENRRAELKILRDNAAQKEMQADKRYQDYANKVRQLQQIIN